MESFLSKDELSGLGLKQYGKNVLIGRFAQLYNPESLAVGDHVRIDDFTVINGRVTLHNHIHIAHFCGLCGGEAGITMEDFTGLSARCSVYAKSDDYTGKSMTNPTVPLAYKPGIIEKPVLIKRHSILGCSSVVLPGVTLGEGVSVGALSLCINDLEPWSIYAGIPAKRVRDRRRDILIHEKDFLVRGTG